MKESVQLKTPPARTCYLRSLVDAGRYRVLEAIGRGGMAEVYRAIAVGPAGFEKEVVVKRILPTLAKDPAMARTIVDEAKIASRLDHPSIVQIYDLGVVDGEFFLVMEYVRGLDLARATRALGRRGELVPVGSALRIAAEVCRALDFAHRQVDAKGISLGIVHRDVSPQNILLSSEGAVKLGDFGIARATILGASTATGMMRGKLGYVAPEQAQGLPLTSRTDIYAAGIVLFEMLTGTHPFAGSTDAETLLRARAPVIANPSSIRPDLDPALDAVVVRALARDPASRYQTAGEMLHAIEAYLRDSQTAVTTTDIAAVVRQATASGPDAESVDSIALDAIFGEEIERLGADDSGLSRFTRTRDLPQSPTDASDSAMRRTSDAHEVRSGDPVDGTVGTEGYALADGARRFRPALWIAMASVASLGILAAGVLWSPNDEAAKTSRTDASAPVPPVHGPSVTPAPHAPRPVPVSVPSRLALPAPSPPQSPSTRPGGPSPTRPVAPTRTRDNSAKAPTRNAEEHPPAQAIDGAAPATLRIGSRPHWAQISIDGQGRGTTPLTIRLPSGSHVIRAVNPALGSDETRRVTVRPGEVRGIVFDPF